MSLLRLPDCGDIALRIDTPVWMPLKFIRRDPAMPGLEENPISICSLVLVHPQPPGLGRYVHLQRDPAYLLLLAKPICRLYFQAWMEHQRRYLSGSVVCTSASYKQDAVFNLMGTEVRIEGLWVTDIQESWYHETQGPTTIKLSLDDYQPHQPH